jgi:hypothetical protein
MLGSGTKRRSAMTRTDQALGLHPATLFAAGELGALPFAFSDIGCVGWLLVAAAVMLAVILSIGAAGRRRRRTRALNALRRGTSST